MMEWNVYAIARALHVLGVVLWIGGVAMVTTVLLPAIRRSTPPAEQYRLFERIEHRFAAQARWSTQLVGASGLAMLWLTDSWARLANTGWLHLMLAVYAVFTLMLFVLEPLLIHRLLASWARQNPVLAMRRLQRMHWLLLAISLAAVGFGVVGAHGGWQLG